MSCLNILNGRTDFRSGKSDRYSQMVRARLKLTPTDQPRSLTSDDLDWMHILNQRYAIELSSVHRDEFAAHIANASYARAIGARAAFLLAYDQDANCDGPNYRWHKKLAAEQGRSGFLYVDRIVVSPDHQRQGLARILYEDLMRFADAQGHGRVVCEVNAAPPNPASDAFHAALGFKVLGQAWLSDRGKLVRYLGRG